ncbi:MAG: methenyltetrahydromethanopterin cyclohydrolase [Planctomycetaceae bacterium]|nr:methenyltetrahydromethanopterin cyclohydrolase [Planctomycetaceae bacterium]
MNWQLNARAAQLLESLPGAAESLRVAVHDFPGGGRVLDFGIAAEGGLGAGLALAQVCTAGLAEISLVHGEIDGCGWPHILFASDHPVAACLLSQYAGWQIGVEKFFAMGSGPMRAAAAREELFQKLDYRESPEVAVGVLEGRKLPTAAVFGFIAEKTKVPAARTTLLIAPTASVAGNFQVVARVVETALHKMFEVGFEVSRVRSAAGTAPLSPVAKDDLAGIGRTNDAILYGGRVTLWVRGDDESIAELGPRIPANSSASYGEPFLKIFEQAGHDFYKIDPLLFSPAEVVFHNLDTGRVQRFGQVNPQVLKQSFGL